MSELQPLGLYIHIPFCERKCPYCDFNTYAGLNSLFDDTVDALCMEMERWAERLSHRQITTIFLGGGTPTVLDVRLLDRIFAQIHRSFDVAVDAEITSEANPGTVDRAKFSALRALGVNRLSMGVQSFQADELRFLGRIHSVDDVMRAWEKARDAGFDNINLDFIFGLPGQSMESWQSTLDQALSMAPEHLSLYSLIVEENTPLHHWVEIGQVAAPDDDEAAAHYETAMECLGGAGYQQYEVSNWARTQRSASGHRLDAEAGSALMPDLACRHNLIYWRNQEYLGIGPGAHSHLRQATLNRQMTGELWSERRWGNRKPVAGYVNRIRSGKPVEAFAEIIEAELSMGETMMLGLRLLDEGVTRSGFQDRYGVELDQVFGHQLDQLTGWGLLENLGDRVRLTKRGLMVGNQVFLRFLPETDGSGVVES